MKNSETRKIAFISGRLGSIFVTGVVRGVEEELREKHGDLYRLSHFNAGIETGGREACKTAAEVVENSGADALIVLSFDPGKKAVKAAQEKKMPVVAIEREVQGIHTVNIDNYRAGIEAARYLIKCGSRRIGIITDIQSVVAGAASAERLAGFRYELKKNGMNIKKEDTATADYHTVECGIKTFDMIKGIDKIDALFSVAGDAVAAGFVIEAKSNGVRVPEDIRVMGFDDMEIASAVEPALTTIRQPINMMGRAAVEIIHGCLNGKNKRPKKIRLKTGLVVRESA
ncbi:MAG TPA: LacI family transcriptional regulator [bacterium]|nr:LacI family transcriptional regulator [bacterium]